jgi:hypothetical protein
MSNFSSYERFLARLLAKFPFAKRWIKFAYARLVYMAHRKNYEAATSCSMVAYGGEKAESFFGYYDKSPSSTDGYVLCHLSDMPTNRLPVQQVKVALFGRGETETPLWVSESKAYNWQQGSRAHWLDTDMFIFNDFDEIRQTYVSRVVSKSKLREVKRFDLPVQDSHGTDYFLSLNYRRLMTLRPDYGYRSLPALSKSELLDIANDGVWKVDFGTGKSRLLVSIADMCKLAEKDEFKGAMHKANHVMISPDGKLFIFLHRYFVGQRRFDRLLLADSNTGDLRLLSDNYMVSHCFWVNNESVLGYLRGPDGKDGYWVIDIERGTFKRFAEGRIDKYGDGHPNVKGNWVVTDTYPDKSRMQHLIVANMKTEGVHQVGEFHHGFGFDGETRCDLHPRFSEDGKSIYFDSVFNGRRKLYRMDVQL